MGFETLQAQASGWDIYRYTRYTVSVNGRRTSQT